VTHLIKIGVYGFEIFLLFIQFLYSSLNFFLQVGHPAGEFRFLFFLECQVFRKLLAVQRQVQHPTDLIEHLLFFDEKLIVVVETADIDGALNLASHSKFFFNEFVRCDFFSIFLALVYRINPGLFRILHPWSEILGQVYKKILNGCGHFNPFSNGIEAGQFINASFLLPFGGFAQLGGLIPEKEKNIIFAYW